MSNSTNITSYGFVDLEVQFSFTKTPEIPAVVNKLPEDCYPAEGGEIEITELAIYAGTNDPVDAYLDHKVIADIREQLESQIADGKFDESEF
jgi:hypothetical protein